MLINQVKTIKKGVLFAILLLSVLFPLFSQDSITVLENGNVGIGTDTPTEMLEIDGNQKVNGDVNVSGNIISNNISDLQKSGVSLFSGMILIETTYPGKNSHKDIDFPPGYTPVNSYILSAKVRASSDNNYWWFLNVAPDASVSGLRIWFERNGKIRLDNAWVNYAFDNQPVKIILAKIE